MTLTPDGKIDVDDALVMALTLNSGFLRSSSVMNFPMRPDPSKLVRLSDDESQATDDMEKLTPMSVIFLRGDILPTDGCSKTELSRRRRLSL
jgi:hypothetical protein